MSRLTILTMASINAQEHRWAHIVRVPILVTSRSRRASRSDTINIILYYLVGDISSQSGVEKASLFGGLEKQTGTETSKEHALKTQDHMSGNIYPGTYMLNSYAFYVECNAGGHYP